MTPVFHLSIPVSDINASRVFYERTLGGEVGREKGAWLDVWIFNIQLTLHQMEKGAVPPEQDRRLHFGATLEWDDWIAMCDRLQALKIAFLGDPLIDEAKGQAKIYLADPDGYVVELKAYRDIAKTLSPR